MENASKALIIAGAILLSILIIGLGMMVFNQAKNAISGASLNSEKIQAINYKFEVYGGTKKGTEIRSLLDLVKNNNLTADNSETYEIVVKKNTENTEIKDASAINTLKTKVKNGNSYTVTFGYSTDGYINLITISGTFSN